MKLEAAIKGPCKELPHRISELGLRLLGEDLCAWVMTFPRGDTALIPLPCDRHEAQAAFARRLREEHAFTAEHALRVAKKLFEQTFASAPPPPKAREGEAETETD